MSELATTHTRTSLPSTPPFPLILTSTCSRLLLSGFQDLGEKKRFLVFQQCLLPPGEIHTHGLLQQDNLLQGELFISIVRVIKSKGHELRRMAGRGAMDQAFPLRWNSQWRHA
ncbi:glucan 1,3-beta-glucosidase A-like isoform X1 [Iris pallida]|uniref:Glucan 1,3-beta-glucosidase A-like isoform X1 n=1 Tax=Iris pallida TaxID=29817 RepID=A0AAX6FHY3_IRIPA|nr:glucan 1,3-beta-glucosidase A-like isoform X1 [Iris pallida]